MRKNYFAKKFVAYSMALAVAFSTITVNPLFIKEAKAAVEAPVTITVDASEQTISNGKAILDNNSVVSDVVQSTIKSGSTVTAVNDLAEAVGLKNNMINPGVTITEDTNITGIAQKSDVTMKYDDFEIDETKLLKGIDGSATVHNVIVDKDEVTLETGVDTGDAVGNGYTWYKLTPAKGQLVRKAVPTTVAGQTVDETITFDYYVFNQINNTGDNYTLDTVTSDELGLYIAVKNTLVDDTKANNYKLFQVVEDSTLEASEERANYYAKEGESVDLVVNATSNKDTINYKWYKGVTPLASTSNVCTIDKVDGTTRGIYTCVVNDGVKEKTIGNINVSSYTATAKPAKNTNDSIKYTSVVKCLVDTTGDTNMDAIEGGKVTLTSCVPKLDDYVYVWTVDTSDMSETDVVNYSASNNSITVVDDSKVAPTFGNKKIYKCYVLNKDEYVGQTTIATALDNVAKAKTEIEKFKMQSALRTSEAGLTTGTLEKLALFEETFYLLDASNKVISSENIVKKLGESVKVEAPTTAAANGVNTIYTDDIATDKNTTTLLGSSSSTEVGKEYAKSALYKDDFGTKRIVVSNDALKTAKVVVADDATFVPGMIYYDATTEEVDNSVTKFNFESLRDADAIKVSDAYNVVAEKFVNIVYDSDLTLSANDVTAKVGSKVKLEAKATSKLPIEYTWDSTTGTMNTTISADSKDHSKTAEFIVDKNDIYKPEKDVNENGVIDASEKEDNYVLCTAFNGVERKTVKIKINQLGGFTYVGGDNKVYTSIETGNTIYPVKALDDKNFTLTANVTPNEETELTYAWYKTSVGGTPLSTEKSYTTKEAALDPSTPVVYICRVTEKGAEGSYKDFTYNVCEATISASAISINKILPQKYTGKEVEPALTVSLTTGFVGDLVAGTDYTVVYENNINTGIARVTVTLTDKLGATAKGITAETTFAIDRADNELEIAGKTVNPGESVLPTTVKNTAKAALTYTYYSDAAGTTEIAVPKTAGVYYVKATAPATTNYNEAVSKVVKMTIRPAVVSKVTLAARGTTSIKASWAKVAGAKGYRVYQKVNGSWVRKADIHATSYTFTGLKAGTTYNFAVKPYLKDGNTPVWAKTYTGLTAFTKPAKVAGFKVASKTRTSVKTTWSKTTGATMYRVYKVVNGKWVKVKDVTGTSYTFTGLKKNTSYKFAVKAFKSGVAAASYPTLTTRTTK